MLTWARYQTTSATHYHGAYGAIRITQTLQALHALPIPHVEISNRPSNLTI
jgi:hypothetical protein